MSFFNTKDQYLTLSEVAGSIGEVMDSNFGNLKLWVAAEISGLRESRGHCYLNLIEKEEGSEPVAEMRATIWRDHFDFISEKFHRFTGQPLKENTKVLFCAMVRFHVRYGLSLNIVDVEPGYTIGRMMLDRLRVVEKLKEKGIYDANKKLEFPLVPQRIAVISAETSRGYEDFMNKLDNNPSGYRFCITLFPSAVQGGQAPEEISERINEMRKHGNRYDVIAIVRGGGGTADLNCYNDYRLAEAIATAPLPVVTGIGHTVDISVADEVAHTHRITPTDVADFFINTTGNFEALILEHLENILAFANNIIAKHRTEVEASGATLAHKIALFLQQHSFIMKSHQEHLTQLLKQIIQKENMSITELSRKITLLDPLQILKRGYSITRLNGRAVRKSGEVNKEDVLTTKLYEGEITSRVI